MDPTIIPPPMWWENATLWSAVAACISAVAACISAFFAALTVYLRNQKSTREMIDIVKADILVFTSEADGRKAWKEISTLSQTLEGEGIGPRIHRLAELLAIERIGKKSDKKYSRAEWLWIIPAAMEELRNEGYNWV